VNANSLSHRRTFAQGQRCQDHGARTAVEVGSLSRVPTRLDKPQPSSRSRRCRLTPRCIRGPKRRDDYSALEEVQVEADLRVFEADLRRTQATVPGITAISSVA
jgi:hypothetical protein